MNVCSWIYITSSGILRLTEFLCLRIQKASEQLSSTPCFWLEIITISYKIQDSDASESGASRWSKALFLWRWLRPGARLPLVPRQPQGALLLVAVWRRLCGLCGSVAQGLLDKDFNQPPSMRPISDNLESSCW